MTLRMAARVQRIEGAVRFRGRCAVCGGRGRIVVTELNEHDAIPSPEGCPRCGECMHVVVRYVTRPMSYLYETSTTA